MGGKLHYYNPKTKEYELVVSGGVHAENKNKTLKGDELIDELDNKANKSHKHSAYDINETVARKFVSENEKLKIKEVDNKANKSYVDTELNKKANQSHTHLASDINETSLRKFVTGSQLSNIDKIPNKADKSYVDEKINDIDINQFDAIDKGSHSFYTLRDPGVYRLWDSSTSPCGTNADYIMAVYKYNNNVIQVVYSSTSTSSTRNKVYVRSYYNNTWSNWRELTNTEIEKEIDEVKQSGVESNKILVDALNSKGVSASTSSTIKTNVGKVKDIKVGDYSIGDTIDIKHLKAVHTDDLGPRLLWTKKQPEDVRGLQTDGFGNIYSNVNGTIYKYDNVGNLVYRRFDNVLTFVVDASGEIICHIGSNLVKYNKSGVKVWSISVPGGEGKILLGNGGTIYWIGYDREDTRIRLYSRAGKELENANIWNTKVRYAEYDTSSGYLVVVYNKETFTDVVKVYDELLRAEWSKNIETKDGGTIHYGVGALIVYNGIVHVSWGRGVQTYMLKTGYTDKFYSRDSLLNQKSPDAIELYGDNFIIRSGNVLYQATPSYNVLWQHKLKNNRNYFLTVDDEGYIYLLGEDDAGTETLIKYTSNSLIGYKIMG